jgi:hypothetical protein
VNSFVPVVSFRHGNRSNRDAHRAGKADERHSPEQKMSQHSPSANFSRDEGTVEGLSIKSRSQYREADIEK